MAHEQSETVERDGQFFNVAGTTGKDLGGPYPTLDTTVSAAQARSAAVSPAFDTLRGMSRGQRQAWLVENVADFRGADAVTQGIVLDKLAERLPEPPPTIGEALTSALHKTATLLFRPPESITDIAIQAALFAIPIGAAGRLAVAVAPHAIRAVAAPLGRIVASGGLQAGSAAIAGDRDATSAGLIGTAGAAVGEAAPVFVRGVAGRLAKPVHKYAADVAKLTTRHEDALRRWAESSAHKIGQHREAMARWADKSAERVLAARDAAREHVGKLVSRGHAEIADVARQVTQRNLAQQISNRAGNIMPELRPQPGESLFHTARLGWARDRVNDAFGLLKGHIENQVPNVTLSAFYTRPVPFREAFEDLLKLGSRAGRAELGAKSYIQNINMFKYRDLRDALVKEVERQVPGLGAALDDGLARLGAAKAFLSVANKSLSPKTGELDLDRMVRALNSAGVKRHLDRAGRYADDVVDVFRPGTDTMTGLPHPTFPAAPKVPPVPAPPKRVAIPPSPARPYLKPPPAQPAMPDRPSLTARVAHGVQRAARPNANVQAAIDALLSQEMPGILAAAAASRAAEVASRPIFNLFKPPHSAVSGWELRGSND